MVSLTAGCKIKYVPIVHSVAMDEEKWPEELLVIVLFDQSCK